MRWVSDSRDEFTNERLEKLTEDIKLDDCQNIGMCSVTCPKGREIRLIGFFEANLNIGLDPRSIIQDLLTLVKDYKEEKLAVETL